MTRGELTAIRDACLSLADRHYSPAYVLTLKHVASDAQAALDGCNASLESVAEYIATDHEIEMAIYPREPLPPVTGSQRAACEGFGTELAA